MDSSFYPVLTVSSEQAGKRFRPHLELARYVVNEEHGTLSCFTGVEHWRRRPPGWIEINPGESGLDKPSYLRIELRSVPGNEVNSILGHLRDPLIIAKVLEQRRVLFSSIAPGTPAYYESFLAELPPPDHRHLGSDSLREAYEILAAQSWTPPSQGDILRCSPDHPQFGSEEWIVVSNTTANRRYFLPQFSVVPLVPVAQSGYPIERWQADGRLAKLVEGAWSIAVEEWVSTIDVTQDWFDRCDTCYDLDRSPCNWLAGAAGSSSCVRCNGASAVWPDCQGHLTDDELELLLRRLHRYLRLGDRVLRADVEPTS